MASIACFVGGLTLIFFWIILSLGIPFLGGGLGDLIFRSATGKNLDNKPYTYIISTIPVLGPIISSFIISKQ